MLLKMLMNSDTYLSVANTFLKPLYFLTTFDTTAAYHSLPRNVSICIDIKLQNIMKLSTIMSKHTHRFSGILDLVKEHM